MSDLVDLPAVEQRRLIEARTVSAQELLAAHLDRIDAAAVNGSVNAVVALDAEVAGRRAAAVDDALANGVEVGPLAGLVTAHKDLTETADFPTTYGSPLFAGFRPPADSLVVARMRAAGAVALGKTNTPEFGAGSHTFNPVYGTTRNPYGLDRSAGGSSGGAAAALACGMVAVADGSDMGGSLRNPAAWNNVVGVRTTPRLVPAVGPGNRWSTLAMADVKATVQDEVRRGRALDAQSIARAYDQLGALWRRAAAFFSRYDLLVAPVTQLAPFPAEWEYPARVAGVEMGSYIEWMAACWRITVLGTPTLSLPAGFDDAGLPVGAQLIGRHGGDVDLLRAASVLEAAPEHHRRRPPVVGAAAPEVSA